MKVLAIIPARSGSKRIKDKNIRLIRGRPLIEYTIEHANLSTMVDDAILSTDNLEYAKFAYGKVRTPFIRPIEHAGDRSTDYDVVNHALQELDKFGKKYDFVVYLRPTSPIRDVKLIENCLIRSLTLDCSVRTCIAADNHHHPYWSYCRSGDFIEPLHGHENLMKRSQDLPDVFFPNGCVDVIKVSSMTRENMYGNKISLVDMTGIKTVDIDTLEDLKSASDILAGD